MADPPPTRQGPPHAPHHAHHRHRRPRTRRPGRRRRPDGVTAVSLEQATDAEPRGTVAIHFRTDRAIRRAANGSPRATAGLEKAQEASVATVDAGRHCYVAYTKGRGLVVGDTSKLRVAIAGHVTTRTVKLRSEHGGRGIGC